LILDIANHHHTLAEYYIYMMAADKKQKVLLSNTVEDLYHKCGGNFTI
jgi:hypothetical protein